MRKYKAWDKELSEWNENVLLTPDGKVFLTEMRLKNGGHGDNYHFPKIKERLYQPEDFTDRFEIVFSTDLKDENGVEIFEGDILEDTVGIGEVKYHPELARYVIYTKTPKHKYYNFKGSNPLLITEIIGNIYENPELLKESE